MKGNRGFSLVAWLVVIAVFFTIVGCKKEETGTKTTVASSHSATVTVTKSVSAAKTTPKKTGATSFAATQSGYEDPGEGDTATEGNDEPDGDEPVDPVQADDDWDVDLGGRTLLFGYSDKNHIPAPDQGDSQVIYKILQEVAMEKYNFKFDYEVSANNNKHIESMKIHALAGTENRNIIRVVHSFVYPWAAQCDYMTEMDPIFARMNSELNKCNQESSKWFGKQYGISRNDSGFGTGNLIWYNRVVFEREGLPDPQILADKNQWDFQALLNISLAATRDFNGDGITDQWGCATSNIGQMWQILLFSNGANIVKEDSSGKVIFNVYDRKVLNALQFAADLVNVYKVCNTNTNIFNSMNWALGLVYCTQGGVLLTDYKSNFGIVIAPKGPDCDKYVTAVNSVPGFYIVPRTTKDADKVAYVMAKIITMVNSPEYNPTLSLSLLEQSEKRLTSWLWFDHRDAVHFTRYYMEMSLSGEGLIISDPFQTMQLLPVMNGLFITNIIQKREPVATALESVLPLGQSKINSIMGY